ncbi:MAG: transcriptional repressor LexA [Patescibacteria group bacterium]
MPEPITPKQKAILTYIESYLGDHDYAPSYREIAEALELRSVATVAEHIDGLKRKGYLHKEPSLARSVQLTPVWDERTFEIPLLGLIAAGAPIEAIRTNETITIPRDMMGPNVFALKVRGDSMIDDGIFEDDYVIIERVSQPRQGEVVVALVDNEAVTLKRYYLENGRVRLQPRNPAYKPIFPKKILVQGRVKGVIRKFN